MKIFFHAPLSQKPVDNYLTYYHYLGEIGHSHTSDFVLKFESDDLKKTDTRKKAKNILKNLEDQVKKADVILLGAIDQSVGSGFLLGLATRLSKPVILLCLDKENIPFFYASLDYNKLIILECNQNNYKTVLPRALSKAEKIIDKRFTLLLPPDVVEMLDNHYEKTGETRSEYIRNLIKDDQAKRALQPPPRYLAPSE